MAQSQGVIEDVSADLIAYVKPRGSTYLVRPHKSGDTYKLAGGIELIKTESAKQVYAVMGEIVECGHRVDDEDVLEPGTRVLYSKYAGIEFAAGDEKFLILSVDDVIGVIMKDAADFIKIHE